MTDDQYENIKALFQRALDVPDAEREGFVRAQAGDDLVLLEGALELLSAHDGADSFLQKPPDIGTLDLGSALRNAENPNPVDGDKQKADRRQTAPAAHPLTAAASPPLTETAEKQCPMCMRTYPASATVCLTDAAPLIPFVDPAKIVGTTLDSVYYIEKLLGQGGMGAVYKARHLLRENEVAIKVLHRRFSSQPAYVQRFLVEGKATSKFSHPNAVTVYDMRTTPDGELYLVQEFVGGESLREEYMKRRTYPPAEVVEILAPIADALDAAHKSGVVHRDLKPDNIMIERRATGKPVVKLLDLGIAKIRGAASELTAEGSWIGTPAYMAPEQWGVKQQDAVPGLDGRADVYSLGVIAFELTAGRWPFSTRDTHEFFAKHTTEAPPKLVDLVPGIPARYSAAVDRALAKQRKDRFMTATGFLAELAASLGDEHPEPQPITPETVKMSDDAEAHEAHVRQLRTQPDARSATGAKIAIGVGGVAVVVLATFLSWPYLFPKPAPVSQPPANASTSNLPAPAPTLAFKYRVVYEPQPATDQPAQYRFLFSAVRGGYLYIVVPGKDDQPTTVLTSLPLPESGVKTNRIEAGSEWRFPDGKYALQNDPGTENVQYTVIFSERPIDQPGVLALKAGQVLSGKDVSDLARVCEEFPAELSELKATDPGAWSEVRFRDVAQASDKWGFCFKLQASSTANP